MELSGVTKHAQAVHYFGLHDASCIRIRAGPKEPAVQEGQGMEAQPPSTEQLVQLWPVEGTPNSAEVPYKQCKTVQACHGRVALYSPAL